MIFGVILVLAALAVFAGGTFSWLIFALLMWGGMQLLFGGRRRRHRRTMRWTTWTPSAPPGGVRPPYPVVPQPVPAPAPPPAVPARLSARLPADVEQQVDRIRRKGAVLAQHGDKFPLGSKDLYVVQHIETDYLQPTIGAYLEVPAWSVDKPAADGRTPLTMLHDQLDLLEGKLDEIADNVRNQRVDRLAANGRFLEERFGQSEEELTIPRRPG